MIGETPKSELDLIDKLNDVLKGEHSAAETYTQVLETLNEEQPEAEELRLILSEHEEAITALREVIIGMGGEARDDSGTWGGWARTITGAATLLGDRASLKTLKEGEEHGLKQYETLAQDQKVRLNPQMQTLIAMKYIPQQHAHIETIDRLMDQIAS